MKRPVFGIALALLIALVSGCANSPRRAFAAAPGSGGPRAFALAVTVQGGLQPTPLQWAAVQAKFADEFSWRDWILVTDLALADYIVRVDFTPDPADPENKGQAVVVAIRDNPRAVLGTLTTLSPYPTSFGYTGTFQNALWSPSFSSAYYGWNDSFYDGYSYSSPTLNPVKPPATTPPIHNPPYRHPHSRPGNPDQTAYCPPVDPTQPHRHYLPGDFAPRPPAQPTFAAADASDLTSRRRWGGNGSRSWSRGETSSSDVSISGSDRTYSRSGAWRSRSDSTYSAGDSARSDRTYSRSGSSSWHSSSSSNSDSSYSRSDSGYSRSGASHSRSDSGSWHSHSDSSSSSSSSSYSPSADSSSSSSSGSFSSGSSGDSGSSDSGGRATELN